MKANTEKIKLWKCPKCGREFKRKDQAHSCKIFPIEQHFIGKEIAKMLYEKFRIEVKKRIPKFKIESIECCIHLVSASTFAAVKIFKNKISIGFTLSEQMKNKRIDKMIQMSANRFLYYVNISQEDEIDEELMNWIDEANRKIKS